VTPVDASITVHRFKVQRFWFELFGVIQPGTLNPEPLNLGKTNEPRVIYKIKPQACQKKRNNNGTDDFQEKGDIHSVVSNDMRKGSETDRPL